MTTNKTNEQSIVNLIGKLFSLLEDRDRRHAMLLLIPALITAVLEMASIGLILPIMGGIIGKSEGSAFADILAFLPDMEADRQLMVLGGLFVIVIVTKNLAILGSFYLINWFVVHKGADFSERLFRIYMDRPYVFHMNRNSATLLRNVSYSVSVSFDGIRITLNIILDLILVLGACSLLVIVAPDATLAIMVIMAAMTIVYYRITAPHIRAWGDREQAVEGYLIKFIRQAFDNIKIIKLSRSQKYAQSVFHDFADERAQVICKSRTALLIPRLFVETLIVISFLLILFTLLAMDYPLADLLSLFGLLGMVALRLMPSMNRIMTGAADLRHRTAPVEELYREYTEGSADPEGGDCDSTKSLPFNQDIRFEDVSFQYGPDSVKALEHVSFTIVRGESIGLVGPSGSGKSTLANILMALISPSEGQVLVDDTDMHGEPPSWHGQIGYVPQQIFLLDDTLRRNIAFGLGDEDIDHDRLSETLQLAHLEDVVSGLPDGLETVIGEHGMRLSGGQRQRVGIARALYRNPAVLVFDEATSALDNETEREIIDAIESLSGKKTVIVIAHRLSTVRGCDRIAILKDGRIDGVGRFKSLQDENAEFKRLVQMGSLDVTPLEITNP